MSATTARTVAITGATGYLGGVLRERFARDGWATVDLVRSPDGRSSRRYVIGEPPSTDLLDGIDVLVHCAYDMSLRTREQIWAVNVDGALRLLDAADAAGVSRTVMLSSMSAYDGTTQLYGLSKLEIERASKEHGALSVRPGLSYGPGAGGMAGALTKLTTLPVVPVVAARSHQFTVHHDDFADAIVALVGAARVVTDPIGIANPVPVAFRELVEGLARLDGRTCRTLPFPWRPIYGVLRASERLGLDPPFRSDSLFGLVHPAPVVPNLQVLADLGVALRRFGQPRP